VGDNAVFEVEQAHLAMEQVLASATFSRSDQLRSFLRYVCERTLAGNGKEINEYSVAVEALGKQPDFSPGADSSVRRSAFELRQKLHKYYEEECQDALIRIELPKGTYAPRFVEVPRGPAIPAATSTARPKSRRRPTALLAAIAAVFLLISGALATIEWRAADRVPGVVREAWLPFTTSGDKVLISLATNFHLVVRPYMTVVADGLPKYPAPPELYPLFRQHRPLDPGVELSMHPVDNSVQLGHAESATIVAANLSLIGAGYQILPERSAPEAALRGRSVILIADPQNSNAAAQALENTPLTLTFNSALQDVVVQERSGTHQVWAGKRGPDKRYTEVFGLITVLPAQGEAGQAHHMVIFSGLTSVGTQGAAEFFSQPEGLSVLKARLQAEGYKSFPKSYQVVVRCVSNDTLLLSTAYAAHRVLAR
jgi:hypothetical protein